MPVFTAAMLDLGHLKPAHVSYEPKDIHTEAILVTGKNIGMLSLEFQVDLLYAGDGLPYFYVLAARRLESDEEGMTGKKNVTVKLGDWIVPLRGEIHVYPDFLFRNTFTFDPGYSPEDYLPDPLHKAGEEHKNAQVIG